MAEGTRERMATENPWQKGLEKQGINFNVPKRFLNNIDSHLQSDEKTGLTVETNSARTHLVRKLSDSIRNGKKWAIVSVDADNLKAANIKIDRLFGDMVIRYGASTVTQFVDKAGLGNNVEAITTTDERAADECSIWLFDISDAEIKMLKDKKQDLDVVIKTNNPNFSFSVSSTILAYDDPRIQIQLEKTKQFLASNEKNVAYDFYQNSVKNTVEKDFTSIKIEKDLDRLEDLPEDQLLTTINMGKFINHMVEIFGNSRVSENVLSILMKLSSVQTAIAMSKSTENEAAYKMLLEGIGVTKEQISSAKTSNDLLNIFRELFGSE